MLLVEQAVSGAPGAAVLIRGGGRVSHPHGISLTARRRTLPRPAVTRRGTVNLVPTGSTTESRPA